MTNFLLPDQPIESVDEYLERGGGSLGLQKAVSLGPRATIEVIRQSGLRGRGGAGFPTGR
ncbi:MAG: NADH-quinone oxidoreductase subunit, partial [Acidimicrobiaceae bacterium]